MTLKDQIKADVATFLNIDEFADTYAIVMGGVSASVVGVLDSDTFGRAPAMTPNDGIILAVKKLYVRGEDLPKRPVIGKTISIDGTGYLITDISDEAGMTVLTLEVYDSGGC